MTFDAGRKPPMNEFFRHLAQGSVPPPRTGGTAKPDGAAGQAGARPQFTSVRDAPPPAELQSLAKKQLDAAKATGGSTFGLTDTLPDAWARQEVGGLAVDLGFADKADRLAQLASGAGMRSAHAYDDFVRGTKPGFTKDAEGKFQPTPEYAAAHKVASTEGRQATEKAMQLLGLPSIDEAVKRLNEKPLAEQQRFMEGMTQALQDPASAKLTDEQKALALAIGFARTTWASSQGPRALVGDKAGNAGEASRVDPAQRKAYNFTGELIRQFKGDAPKELFKDLEQLGAKWSAA